MASSVPEFWKLVEQSRLLAAQQCQQLDREFQSTNGSTNHASPQALGEWLVGRNIFSRYQVTVLLAGRPGPFVYGDYKIYDRIETGRLANDFRAVHGGTGHPVLLRFLSGPVVQDARIWAAAATEAQVACSVAHPNLQRYFELVDLGAFKFLVSEDLHGDTLGERLAAGRMPPMEACRIARLMALGLAALHPSGRAHGDVRPLNVWLEPPSQQHPGNAKLLRDPLLPPAPPNFAAEDPYGWLLAQSDYLAPEFQIPGKMPDVLTDLYALGCTLYHLLAGHPPFPGGNTMQKVARHAGEAIRPLESYGVPQPLAQLVTFLMAKNPALRYQDAKTVADQLAAFIDPAVVHLPAPPSLPTLPAYEAAMRQSQARLAARTVQNTFGVAPTAAAPEPAPVQVAPAAAAPVVRTAEAPATNIPKGKAVGATAAIAPAAAVKPEPAKIIEPALTDPKAIAAKEARERKKLVITLVSVGAAAIALIIGLNMWGGGKSEETEITEQSQPAENIPPVEELTGVQSKFPPEPTTDHATETTPVANSGAASSATSSGPTFEVVADDGKLPWASPTTGEAIDLKYVPPLARVFIVVRPAELLATPEGPRVLQALGPQFEAVRSGWEQAAGVKLADCEQLIVSLHDNDNKYPKVSVVARLKSPIAPADLVAKWGNPAAQMAGTETFYVGPGWAYYAPASENGQVFLMAPTAADAKEAIESPVPLLKREMEKLRRATDDTRHVTVLYDPTFLFSGEGDPLFTGEFARVKQPLQWLLGEGLQAGVVSMHFADTFYFEMRSHTKVDKRPQELAEDFRKRLAQVPGHLTDYFAESLNPPPYWRKLAFKFPSMIEQLHEQTRVGVEDDQAVVNAVLPITAAHNLVLGIELTMATAPGGMVAATATATNSGPKTLEEALNLKVKAFAFDSLPFENAMRDLAADVQQEIKSASFEFSIELIGKDLEMGGVTRNKSVTNFKEENKTVAEMLTALAMKANPVAVTAPSSAEQTLVWLVGESPTDKKKKIIVTTRAGAANRGYTLPPAFQPK
jgi:serine/threonine-protein kinase